MTQATARQFGYTGHMRDYPKAEAIKVYTSYWNQLRLSTIEVFDADLATYLFDYGVNSGPGRAATDFQRLLNVLNDRQKLYPDVKADGAIGPRSLSVLESFAKARGAGGLAGGAVNSLRIAHCVTLAERQESQEAMPTAGSAGFATCEVKMENIFDTAVHLLLILVAVVELRR